MHGLVRRIPGRQFPPLCPGAQNPQHAIQHRSRIGRRTPPTVGPLRKPQVRLQEGPFLVRHLSPCVHMCFRRITRAITVVRSSASDLKPKHAPLFIGQVLVPRKRSSRQQRLTRFAITHMNTCRSRDSKSIMRASPSATEIIPVKTAKVWTMESSECRSNDITPSVRLRKRTTGTDHYLPSTIHLAKSSVRSFAKIRFVNLLPFFRSASW